MGFISRMTNGMHAVPMRVAAMARALGRTTAAALSLAACVLLAVPLPAQSQDFPNRPVTLVIGYAPGGGTDIVGRILAREMERELGVPVVVDNRPGAGTLLAAQHVMRATPDGYTLFFGTNAMVINSVLKGAGKALRSGRHGDPRDIP